MSRLFEKSLLLRLGLAMATITALAFIGMLSSVIIAETTQGAAGAINQAGSLRMQSYRIATDLVYSQGMDAETYWRVTEQLVQEFEDRLNSSRLGKVLPSDPRDRLFIAYNKVEQQWHRKIKPVLNVFVEIVAPDDTKSAAAGGAYEAIAIATKNNIRKRYINIVDGFVADIDNFVKLLEEDAESKIQRLRLIQGVSLFLTLVVVFITMYLMHTEVLVPLRDLLTCAEAARRGDLSVRTQHQSDDELGRLGRAFNVMAEDLSKMYADLEARVRVKTVDLERTNRSLELLYNTTRRLNEAILSDATYSALLHDIEEFTGVGPGTICLADPGSRQATRLATTRKTQDPYRDLCTPPNCDRCLGDGTTLIFHPGDRPGEAEVIAIPIKEKEQQYGVLLLEKPPYIALENWQMRLLEAVADHIGIAINLARQANQSRRLALLEERSVIARELHDSLAQSLSYLKIQASRLDAALAKGDGDPKARDIVEELREGISSAYRQLRELLTTFRLQMDGRGLSSALNETVIEFNDRTHLDIRLDNQLGGCRLSANEEIHILQIVREALSNVVRHAQAETACVTLQCNDDNRVTVRVDDDGIGIPGNTERRHHYGLAIINERAESLGGQIQISALPDRGTRVELTFMPAHLRREGDNLNRGFAS